MIGASLSAEQSRGDDHATYRIEALDYLRGLLATSVMAYHYVVWSGVPLGADSVLGRLGIYAVSTFYILSGLSLGIAYKGRLSSPRGLRAYAIKRVFRIVPLFWVTVTLYLVLMFWLGSLKGIPYDPDWSRIYLNYSLLFGFLEPDGYLTAGAWSIGNEVVFYCLLPVFLCPGGARSRLLLLVVALVPGVWFAGNLLHPDQPLREQWALYVNPLNQLPLFVAGLAIALVPAERRTRNQALGIGLALLGVIGLISWPADGDQVTLVTGMNRLVFSATCALAVLGVYLSGLRIPRWRFLALLGEGSYSIYLLHPIAALVTVDIASQLGIDLPHQYLLAVLLTMVASWLSFRFLERPLMQLGSRIARSPASVCVAATG